ncbi:MAG: CoA transferase [Chloroflexi bacterium]|nr:CoA transferase [Chloroflexota bacterium]
MQPLEGYRVLDFGSAWAGPMAAQLLADMGAEVIKVESRARMDGLRLGRPIVGDDVAGGDRGLWPDLQPAFHGFNRNKLSITVNLKHPEGVALIKRLVPMADVVTNNFAPGVMERLGLGYEELRAIRRDIIVVSMPAAGESGPLKDIIAYATIIHALSGLMSMVGYEGEPLVGQLQAAWSDALAAMHAAVATATALYHRRRTGEGQYIEVSQWEATTSMLGEAIMDYAMNGRVAGPMGNYHPMMAPHNNYPCRGDDRWVSIAVASEEEWQAFCRALGDPEWARDTKFADAFQRQRNRAELDARIAEWTCQHDAHEVTEFLQGAGVAAMTVMNIEDQFLDPHFRERGFHVEVEHPKVGLEWLYGQPWLLSDTPGSVRRHAPLLGEHNEYVFRQLLEIPAEEYERLVKEQALY